MGFPNRVQKSKPLPRNVFLLDPKCLLALGHLLRDPWFKMSRVTW
jgi:hypothetical protein